MLKRSTARLTTRLNGKKLFEQVNQDPLTNWKGAYAQKLAPHPGAAEAIHKLRTEVEGPEYGQLTANNFPYPLMYGTILVIWAWFAVSDGMDLTGNEDCACPVKSPIIRNPDGTTVISKYPQTPTALFTSMVQVRD